MVLKLLQWIFYAIHQVACEQDSRRRASNGGQTGFISFVSSWESLWSELSRFTRPYQSHGVELLMQVRSSKQVHTEE